MQIFMSALFFSTLMASPVFAGREMRTIPLNIFSTNDFTLTANGGALPNGPSVTVYGDPQRVGAKVEVMLNIVNLSNKTQTGTVSFLSAAAISARAVCQESGVYTNLSGYLYLCQPGQPTRSSVGSLIAATTSFVSETNLPAPIAFSIAGNDAVRIVGTFVVYSTFGSPPSSCKNAYVDYTSAFKIVVNEEVGAVAASLTPRVSPIINYTTATSQYCGVGTQFSNTFAGHFENLPITPIMVNGGRPF